MIIRLRLLQLMSKHGYLDDYYSYWQIFIEPNSNHESGYWQQYKSI